jgi:hypothetical protein
MSKRWFSGVLIFALGFGSTFLATNAMAQEPHQEKGELEEGLGYVMTGNEVRLVNTGKYIYLVMVQRSPGTSPADAPISYIEGTASLPVYSLNRLVAYRLTPIAVLADQFWRSCAMGDCSWTGPLPPPPPPLTPPDLGAILLTP